MIIFKIIVQLPIVSFGLEAFLTKFSWVGFFTHRKTIRNCNFTLRYICLHPTRRILGKKVRGGEEEIPHSRSFYARIPHPTLMRRIARTTVIVFGQLVCQSHTQDFRLSHPLELERGSGGKLRDPGNEAAFKSFFVHTCI